MTERITVTIDLAVDAEKKTCTSRHIVSASTSRNPYTLAVYDAVTASLPRAVALAVDLADDNSSTDCTR